MKAKTKEALGMGFGGVVGSALYQANQAGLADMDLARAVFSGMLVGLVWLLIPLRLSRRDSSAKSDSVASTDKDIPRD
jgi:hypothetical protein